MRTFIRFPKPIIGAVNGPAIGIGTTIIPFCDISYCSETTYFQSPFSRLALAPEFCSSITFPQILGRSVANELLLLSKQLSCKRAEELGFVSKVLPKENFMAQVLKEIESGLEYPLLDKTFPLFKNMIRKWDYELLDRVCVDELRTIDIRARKGEISEAIRLFLKKKAAAKM